ncbi:DUF3644 domain-containing protein [Shouchella miscanthi]|uniref:DUF3644 domain-containing protein n=1 Tax=Shouchella miscanthi TaxID=2598861 RepID=UPI001FEAC23A|nr:DUF3644 domain-containing protein [Shouchella miscanthi]
MATEKPIADRLLDKSHEAFILGIEIYNKPTIQYRVEGFAFFICNAWELMLKSHLIKKFGENSIYYKESDRTISLEYAVKQIFTNDKDPLRKNLEKIIELRNTSTHFITEEYEMVYIPLFQSCVINFSEKLSEFHNFDVTTLIPQNFLTLNVSMEAIDNSKIIAKYPEEIAKKIIDVNEEISYLSKKSNAHGKFAIVIEHQHFLVKDKSKATSFVGIDNNSDVKIKVLREIKDPNKTHPHSAKNCINSLKKRLGKSEIEFGINMHVFLLFVDYFELKSDEAYCFQFQSGESGKQVIYRYSQRTIDLIYKEIEADPEYIYDKLKEGMKKR